MIDRPAPLQRLRDALRVHPVGAVLGPRQCGKSTLARVFAETYALDEDLTVIPLPEVGRAVAGSSS